MNGEKKPDALLDALGAVAREEGAGAAEDPRWEALAAGELSEAEEKELRALAGESEEGALAWEGAQPFDEATRQRFADAVLERREKVVPIARARRRRGLYVVAAVAAAAAVLLVLWPRGAALPELPGYEIAELRVGARETRAETPEVGGGGPQVVRLGRGERFVLVARPGSRIEGPVAVHAYRVGRGVAHAWDVPVQVAETGALRVEGDADALFPAEPGPWTLVFAVGRPDEEAPAPEAIAGAAKGGAIAGWRLIAVSLRVESAAP